MNRPVITSLTKVCAPKPIASPTTPAPASSGPMSTPISDSTINVTRTMMRIIAALRSSGSRGPGARAARQRIARSVGLAEIALDHRGPGFPQASTAIVTTTRIAKALDSMRRPIGEPSQPNESTPQTWSRATAATR